MKILASLPLSILFFSLATVGFAEAILLTPTKIKELLLTQGLGVQLLKVSLEAKKQDLPNIRSRFDTLLTLDSDHNIDKSARTSTFFGSRTDTSHWNLGLEKLVPSGTTFGFRLLNERKEVFNASTVTRTPTGATYEPALEFRLNQSLGENFFGGLDRAEVERVQRSVEALDFQTRHEVNKLVVEAQALFWNWVTALEAVQNGKEALQAAQGFFKITQEKETMGLVQKTDRLGAQAMVAKREAFLKNVEAEASQWESRIKTILNLDKEVSLAAETPVLTTSAKTPAEAPAGGEDQAIQWALENRFDLQGLKQTLEEKNIQLVIAKQKKLPLIDFTNTLQLNEVAVGDYAQALRDMDSPNWTVGLQLKLPLENREARSLKTKAEHEKFSALLQLKQLEQAIVQDVTHKFRSVRWAEAAWIERQKAFNLEAEKLTTALEAYRQARFNAELVLQYQDDFLEAKQEALKAKLNFAMALLALKEAKNHGL